MKPKLNDTIHGCRIELTHEPATAYEKKLLANIKQSLQSLVLFPGDVVTFLRMRIAVENTVKELSDSHSHFRFAGQFVGVDPQGDKPGYVQVLRQKSHVRNEDWLWVHPPAQKTLTASDKLKSLLNNRSFAIFPNINHGYDAKLMAKYGFQNAEMRFVLHKNGTTEFSIREDGAWSDELETQNDEAVIEAVWEIETKN